MTLFDPLFIAVFFGTIVMLVLAGVALLRRRRARAIAIMRRLGIFAGVYLGIVILVALASPRRVLNVGDDQCWDDWCIAVTNVHRQTAEDAQTYEVTLRVSSRAHRRAQRALDARVYLMDGRGPCTALRTHVGGMLSTIPLRHRMGGIANQADSGWIADRVNQAEGEVKFRVCVAPNAILHRCEGRGVTS